MSDFTLILVRFAYLAVLWLFVLSAVSVIRSDMFGARAARDEAERRPRKRERKQARPRRGDPSEVVILEGSNRGERISLSQAPLLIGRGTDAAIRLDDDYVSTRHARIACTEQGQWYVEDLGSTNGTYVGAGRITQPTALQLGTQVRIGKTILELRK